MREIGNLARVLPRVSVVLGAMALLVGVMTTASGAAEGDTFRVSVSSSEGQANDFSGGPSISSHGRFVAFSSYASNLVPNDTNCSSCSDVFVRDRLEGTTERVSVDSSERQANMGGGSPSISSHGRFVAFSSGATNLVPNDTNGEWDVFVRDRLEGTTERVSVDGLGEQGNDYSHFPSISASGRFVAFSSGARNLVANDTSRRQDLFVHDRRTGKTERVNVNSSERQANRRVKPSGHSISADGRFVAFSSRATNLVASDTNGRRDVFVRDRLEGTTKRVSVDSSGTPGNGACSDTSISSDGRFVAFACAATNLVANDTNNGRSDVFVRDRLEGTTKLVSVNSSGDQFSEGRSVAPSISSDGRFVAFVFVSGGRYGDFEVFVRDRQRGTTERASVNGSGTPANDDSYGPSISSDGSFVAFQSYADNLVANDTNNYVDAFVHQR